MISMFVINDEFWCRICAGWNLRWVKQLGDYCRTEREWPGGGGAWLGGRAGSGRCLAIYGRASGQAPARLPRAAPLGLYVSLSTP